MNVTEIKYAYQFRDFLMELDSIAVDNVLDQTRSTCSSRATC